MIPKELGFDHEPCLAGGGVALEVGIGEVIGDRSGDPGLDNVIHAHPVQDGQGGGIAEDVVLEGILADDEDEPLAPPCVAAGVEVEDGVDETQDVLDGNSLSVDVQECSNFVKEHGILDGVVVLRRRAQRGDAVIVAIVGGVRIHVGIREDGGGLLALSSGAC